MEVTSEGLEETINGLKGNHNQLSGELVQLLNFSVQQIQEKLREEYEQFKEEYGDILNADDNDWLEGFINRDIDDNELTKDFLDELKNERQNIMDLLFYMITDPEKIDFFDVFDIEDFLKKNQEGYQSLKLTFNPEQKVTIVEIAQIFAMLPKDLVHLEFFCKDLFDYPKEQIFEAFKNLPQGIRRLNLNRNKIWNLDLEDYKKFLSILPPNLIGLSLNRALPSSDNPKELASIIKYIPRQLKMLDLGDVDLGIVGITDFQATIEDLPKDLVSLNLANNSFFTYSYNEHTQGAPNPSAKISAAFRNFCEGVNDFGSKTWNKLAERFPDKFKADPRGSRKRIVFVRAMKCLPKKLQRLHLGTNGLGGYEIEDLVEIIDSLPDTIRYLNLNKNELISYSMEDLLKLVKVLPPKLKNFSIVENDIGKYSIEELEMFMKALPRDLEELNLAMNYFNYSDKELTKVFAHLPPGLNVLNLSNCGLHTRAKEELGIPKQVKVIGINAFVTKM